MSPVFLEGERGHISQAGDYDIATNNAFENALFDRSEVIPTTRNNVGVSQPAGLAEKEKGKENAGNGSMAKIPAKVLLAQN
jgi:hypothetical protein